MSVQIFRLQGTYRRTNRNYRFSKEIRASSEKDAREQLYSILGSCHRVQRKTITIKKVDIITPQEAEQPLIRKLSGIE
ncbi:MAG: 50S ribosomal protein L18Ae [Promethearchaeota archaeon]